MSLGRTVGELEQSLTIHEFVEWQAYNRLDPMGGYRGDLQAALIAASNVGGNISDYLLIDPNPMTEEMQEQYEYQQRLAELEAEEQALIARLQRLENKE